jgi:hypothetical protein
MDLTEFFGEPISIYTDAQALEDGVLVDASMLGVSFKAVLINRVTQHVWSDLEQFFKSDSGASLETMANALRTKCNMAAYRGGIWILPPNLWLIENEVGGWTMLYPDDY